MKNKILIVILIIFIVGMVAWSMSKRDKLTKLEPHELDNTDPLIVQSKIQEQERQQKIQDAINRLTGELKIYQNKEVGISFKYPDIFERVDIGVHSGETGRTFSGILEFAPNHRISFGGVTKDYIASRGGSLTDTRGYEKQGEKYAIKFVWGNEEVVPSELWPVNSGKDQAIIIRNMEIEQILSRETIAAFVNVPNSPFPGVVFGITPSSPDKLVNEKEIKILRQIVSSITFME